MAFETLSVANLPCDRIVKAVRTLADYAGVMGMIGGQVIDLESEGKEIDEKTLEATYDLKNGSVAKGCM